MTEVLAQKEFIDLLLYLFIGVSISFAGFIGAWLYDFFRRTPRESKIVKRAYNTHRPLDILQTDDGHTDFKIGHKLGPEGIHETLPEGKMGKRKNWTGLVARKVDIDQVKKALVPLNLDDDKVQLEYERVVDFLNDSASHPTVSRSGIPILVGYQGKAPLTRIAHLFGLKALEKLIALYPDSFISVDLTAIKTLFPMPWDSTQIQALKQLKHDEGYEEGKKIGHYNEFKILLLMMICAFGLLAAAALIWKFL